MTSPNRAARAYVEIVGDYRKLQSEASAKINAALRDAGADVNFNLDEKARSAGASFGDAFQKSMGDTINREFRAGARGIVDGIGRELNSDRSRGALSRAFRALAGVGAAVLGGTFALLLGGGAGLGKFVDGIKSGAGALTSLFGSISSGGATALIKLGLMIIVIPHLVSVIFPLIANLTSLIGLLNLLPAVSAIALGAIIPLIVGFQNMGDAFGAVLDGDPEKIATALEKLAPAARSVVREFQGLLPQLRELQRTTQQNLFGPIQGALTELFAGVGIDRMAQGFANVASALGTIIGQFIRLGATPAFQALGEALFGNAQNIGAIARTLQAVFTPLMSLLQAFANAATGSLPIVESLASKFGSAIADFAAFINATVEDGRFNAFLQDALQTTGDLKDLIGEVLALFFAIFKNTDDGGERFLQKVTAAVAKLTEYFESEDGKAALATMLGLAEAFAAALGLAAAAAGRLLDFLVKIENLTAPTETSSSGGSGQGGPRAYAKGGIITQPTFALMGEAGAEAVVPLDDPKRAAEVMSQAGLVPLAENMAAGHGMLVQVFLGTREIEDVLDTRVQKGLRNVARSLGTGPRG